jgi:uncharacterized protein (TIGR03086 family)
MNDIGGDMEQLQRDFRKAVEHFGETVRQVGEDQWANDTPCTDWDVHALVNHLVNEAVWIPPLMEGSTVPEVGGRFDGDLLGNDPVDAWDRAAEAAIASMSRPGVLENIVHVSFGDISGEEYCSQLFTDYVIHGWDLARGIGAEDAIDPGFAAQLYEQAAPRAAEMRTWGVFGDHVEVPENADVQTKLLAIYGRRQ